MGNKQADSPSSTTQTSTAPASPQQPMYKAALQNFFKGVANNMNSGPAPAPAQPVQQLNLMQPYQAPQAPSTNFGSTLPTSLKGMTRGR